MRLRSFLFLVLVLAATGVQIGLGLWQWQRMGEKRAFIAALASAEKAEPVAYSPDRSKLWQRVSIEGRYLHDKTAYVRTSRGEKQPGGGGFGVRVLTPLAFSDCSEAGGSCRPSLVYVDRGFLPTPPDGAIPAHDKPEGVVRVSGFLRPDEKSTLFQPGNDPARGVWFTRAILDMAVAAKLTDASQPALSLFSRFIHREAAQGEAAPEGISIGEFLKAIPDNHFQYALTWWALAATNLVVMGFFLASRRKRRETG